jgi:hypothetical protein
MNHATTIATAPRQALPGLCHHRRSGPRANVAGFDQLYKDLERSISVSGKSASTLTNYGCQLVHLALTGKSRDERPNGAGACVLKTGELASNSIRLKNLPITGSVQLRLHGCAAHPDEALVVVCRVICLSSRLCAFQIVRFGY